MKVKVVAFILLAMLLALGVTPVYAGTEPALPHAFYGTVEVNGSPAPVGTQVEARGEGVETDIGNNPIEVTVAGQYGGSGGFDAKLIVSGDVADGAPVTFYVNGVSTGQTAEWHSGGLTEVDLAVTIDESSTTTTTSSSSDTSDSTSSGTDESSSTTTDESTADTTDSTSPEPTESPESTGPAPEEPASPASPTAPLPPSPPTGPGGWPVLWWVIGGVVVVGLIIFVVARRRAY